MQPIKPIHNEADYELALQDIDRCLDAAAGSPERDRLEVLTVLVDNYEAKHYPISPGRDRQQRTHFRGDEQTTPAR
jgi:HTH-type transcriptional regulator/antitoxin HigA